jgi:hypothetical protein
MSVVDPKTHLTLWSFTKCVRRAILLGNRDKNFDPAMNTVVGRMQQLLDQPAAAADQPRK